MSNNFKYQRGSEWRKWDLHVHTPASLVHGYGNADDTWEKFICDLENLPADFKVIGINDYMFIEGYRKVLDYKARGRLTNIDLILPVLEFRISKFAGTDSKFKKVNFHVIFVDNSVLSPDVIQQQFLNALTNNYRLAPGIDGNFWSGILSLESLVDLGRKIKETVPADKLMDYGTDVEEGFRNITIKEDDILNILDKSSYFKKEKARLFLTAVGKAEWDEMRWQNGSITEKKDVINKVDFVFVAAESIDKYHKAHERLKVQKVNSNLLDCSDAHTYSNQTANKDRIGNCFTWIKADPTFEGLKQVLREFNDRVHVGERPQKLDIVQANGSKYIKRVVIKKKAEANLQGIWFNNEISLNYDLVAIIGNRGMGKSALAETIGLLGFTKNHKDFSFLNDQKFKKQRLADSFEAEIKWADDKSYVLGLSYEPEVTDIERVKFIPQHYLENLCNKLDDSFQKEINNVIYSHVPETNRLGKNNLKDLIDYMTLSLDEKIQICRSEIQSINQKLIDLEQMSTSEYTDVLKNKLHLKNEELRTYFGEKPQAIVRPDKDKTTTSKLQDTLKDINDQIKKIESQIVDAKSGLKKLNDRIGRINAIVGKIETFLLQYDKIKTELSKEIKDILDVDFEDILKIEYLNTTIEHETKRLKEERNVLVRNLTETPLSEVDKKDSLLHQLHLLSQKSTDIQKQLDEPAKQYQKYLMAYRGWKTKYREINNQRRKIKDELVYINSFLQDDINKARQQREDKVKEIFTLIEGKIKIYETLYAPVIDFIDREKQKVGKVEEFLNFSVMPHLSRKFMDEFLSFIDKGRKGSFQGIQESEVKLANLIRKFDFTQIDNILDFINEIVNNLTIEIVQQDPKPVEEPRVIEKQLVQGRSKLDLYNYFFNLSYILVDYQLKWGEKPLFDLSPGERGILLLIFYLLLDPDDVPLIIDQPEENLDSESVFYLLVPYIKEAKKRRQIIIVTHNPNLAVVCDAEQIIYTVIDKQNKNQVQWLSGSIENPIINIKIINVLEGTKPAFENREQKYGLKF